MMAKSWSGLHSGKLVVAYNMTTGEIRPFHDFSFDLILKHTNNLVSWQRAFGREDRKQGVVSST
ncbi:hypothetical protein ACSBR2_004629 [Camellia fascicularis]